LEYIPNIRYWETPLRSPALDPASLVTHVTAPPLCPELRLSLAEDFERAREVWDGADTRTAQPPYWSIAWVGGQALARLILDRPALVRGRRVLDVGSGCGICAIAAARAGALTVEAADIDRGATAAIASNAALNDVTITVSPTDPIGTPPRWDVVLAADMWYERFLAARLTAWLASLAGEGVTVLLGDCRRAYFPRMRLIEMQRYAIPDRFGVERAAIVDAGVWRMQ